MAIYEQRVLDHGSIELLEIMPAKGSLIHDIAETARVSYAEGTKSFRDDVGLVEYLVAHGHWSPFDQQKFRFRVRCPLFVRAQWYRHWSWDYNEESGRYSKVKEEYHIPDHLRVNDPRNRQATHELLGDPAVPLNVMKTTMEAAYAGYQLILGDAEQGEVGVAREQARMILPQSMYTTFRATCSLRQLIFFLHQRRDAHAQWEIRQYADAIHGFLIQHDVDLVNLLENWVWGAVVVPANARRLLGKVVDIAGDTGNDIEHVAREMDIRLRKYEREALDRVLHGR